MLDDINSQNNLSWQTLVSIIKRVPHTFLIGSVRTEDVTLVSNKSETALIEVKLSESLAVSVWQKLKSEQSTQLTHWREAFEQSEGLMLEYVHILTQGYRLRDVINEQITLREQEGRFDELSIIRSVSSICFYGGHVDSKELIRSLKLKPQEASIAFKRLINEHMIKEQTPGVLGDLHDLRTSALKEATHDELSYFSEQSAMDAINAVTIDTLPLVIFSIFNEISKENHDQFISRLYNLLLEKNDDTMLWSQVFLGLGYVTLNRHVDGLVEQLTINNVEKSLWSFAFFFADSAVNVDTPVFTEFEEFNPIKQAIEAYRKTGFKDLREDVLNQFQSETIISVEGDLQEINLLLSSLSPIEGRKGQEINNKFDINFDKKFDIIHASKLLSTASYISNKLHEILMNLMGGEQALIDQYFKDTPFITYPVIHENGAHGITIESNYLLAGIEDQDDVNQKLNDICETLINFSPGSQGAAAKVIYPDGEGVIISDQVLHAKDRSRETIYPKARVHWNKQLRMILKNKFPQESETKYVEQMGNLLIKCEKYFRKFTEQWLGPKGFVNKDRLAEEGNSIIQDAKDLTSIKPTSGFSSKSQNKDIDKDSDLGDLIIEVVQNTTRSLNQISEDTNLMALACSLGKLSLDFKKHIDSNIWRLSTNPPNNEIIKISERLLDLSFIIHEIESSGFEFIFKLGELSKKTARNRIIPNAANKCKSRAQNKLKQKISQLNKIISQMGWPNKCFVRPINDPEAIDWPCVEMAFALKVKEDSTPMDETINVLEKCHSVLGDEKRVIIVPQLRNSILCNYAHKRVGDSHLSCDDFKLNWENHINIELVESKALILFDKAVASLIKLSLLISSLGVSGLKEKEAEVFDEVQEELLVHRKQLNRILKGQDIDHSSFLNKLIVALNEEFNSLEKGEKTANPIWKFYAQLITNDSQNEKVMGYVDEKIDLLLIEFGL